MSEPLKVYVRAQRAEDNSDSERVDHSKGRAIATIDPGETSAGHRVKLLPRSVLRAQKGQPRNCAERARLRAIATDRAQTQRVERLQADFAKDDDVLER